MRRLSYGLAAVAALVSAGFAVADNGSPKAIKAVSATFSATTVSSSSTQTCTNADGVFVLTNARYTGTATSTDPSLSGPLTVQARSSINTTRNLGTVDGTLRIALASGRHTDAHFTAVYQNGQLGGLAAGGMPDPYARLLGNLSAGFSATGGFTDGRVGATSGGGAIETQGGRCQPTRPPKPTSERSEARGTVSALSATSITVGGLTCAIPANAALTARLARVKLGARATIRCTLANGQSALTAVKAHR